MDTTSTHHTGPLPAERGKCGRFGCGRNVVRFVTAKRTGPSRDRRFGATRGIASHPVEHAAVDGNGMIDFVNRELSEFQFARVMHCHIRVFRITNAWIKLRELHIDHAGLSGGDNIMSQLRGEAPSKGRPQQPPRVGFSAEGVVPALARCSLREPSHPQRGPCLFSHPVSQTNRCA